MAIKIGNSPGLRRRTHQTNDPEAQETVKDQQPTAETFDEEPAEQTPEFTDDFTPITYRIRTVDAEVEIESSLLVHLCLSDKVCDEILPTLDPHWLQVPWIAHVTYWAQQYW